MKMKTTTINENIVKQLKEGDLDAFHLVYDHYWSDLLLFALHFLKRREEAEEAVQDIFLKLWEKRQLIDEGLSFNGFVFVVAKRILVNKIKLKSKYKFIEVAEDVITKSDTEDPLICQELLALSEKAISLLPSKREQIFRMSRERGLSHNDIAQELGISQKTVENQIILAMKGIKEYLGRHSDYSFLIVVLLEGFI
jgi:RNA polymerase sigma-70 factor, ECF subfamily